MVLKGNIYDVRNGTWVGCVQGKLSTWAQPLPSYSCAAHLVLLATPFFAIVEDIVAGVILRQQEGFLDLPLPSHQQKQYQ